jgi:hypothetical protein
MIILTEDPLSSEIPRSVVNFSLPPVLPFRGTNKFTNPDAEENRGENINTK